MNGYEGRRLGASQPKNINEITPKLIKKILENLNPIEKLNLSISGYLFIDNIKFEGWSGELPFYLFKCKTHGYELNYASGYVGNLLCLDCIREQIEKMPDLSKLIYEKYIHIIEKEEDESIADKPKIIVQKRTKSKK